MAVLSGDENHCKKKRFTLFFCNSCLVNLDVIFLRGYFWFMCNCITPLSDLQGCSIGQLIWPLNESNKINRGGGTYFLPDKVSCNGRLVSLHTCFFYNDEGNSSNNDFRLRVGVFKQTGDSYTRDKWISIDVTRQNSSETKGCASLDLPDPVPVLAGDRIAVRLRNQCQMRCPLQPNLNAPRSTSVFFIRSNVVTIPVSQVMATQSYTNVYLDVSASIGEFHISHGSRTSKVHSIEADVVLKSCYVLYSLVKL